jgi:hypothetical protein
MKNWSEDMKHLSEEQLVLHYYGEETMSGVDAPTVDRHLAECSQCRSAYHSLQLVLNTVDGAPVPERGPEYGAQVWQRIESKTRRRFWMGWLQPRWWVLVPTAATMLALAFFAGRISKQPQQPAVAGNQVRERILLVAVGDHLDRSQMVLAELSNAPDGKGKIDISDQQQLAEELLDDNRLYRQAAHRSGDNAVAGVLDDLERVLLEIAHSPSEMTNQQLEQLRQEIRERGLLFKVRVVGSQVRQRELTPRSQASKDSKKL